MGANILVSGVLVLAIAGCATSSADSQRRDSATPLSDAAAVTTELQIQYAEWGGTRYRLGGTDKDGIDCSGFTYVTFLKRFGIQLPRTTVQQVRLGVDVSRRDLRPGDLVFFRTGYKNRHVGIYAGNQKFLHASTSRGVMLSSMNNPYWRGKFWTARRLRS